MARFKDIREGRDKPSNGQPRATPMLKRITPPTNQLAMFKGKGDTGGWLQHSINRPLRKRRNKAARQARRITRQHSLV